MKKLKKIGILLLSLQCAVFAGCAALNEEGTYQDSNQYQEPVFDAMTQRSINYEGPARNPVIVIHGLLGAKLEDSKGNAVWGEFSYPGIRSGKYFEKLAHPMAKGVPLEKLKNDSHQAGLLAESKILLPAVGMEFELSNYNILVDSLKRAGYVPETEPLPSNKNFPSLFVFSYDWRRDISENAAELQKFILEKRAIVQKAYSVFYNLPDYDVQFDLVGHSMGGLVARCYMRFGGKIIPDEGPLPKPDFSGAKYVDKVIIVGTPNAGYSDTLLELTNGLRLVPAAPPYPPALLGTFLSYYEMLPDPDMNQVRDAKTKKPIDLFDKNVWIRNKWGLMDEDEEDWLAKILPDVKTAEERRAIAEDHLEKALRRAKRFKQAMSFHAEKYPDDVSVWLIAGHTVMTNAILEVDEQGKITCVEKMIGDGKITYASCCKDLRATGISAPCMLSPIDWKAIFLMQGAHMGIMNSPVFDARLRQLLLDTPTHREREVVRRKIELIRGNNP